MKRKRKLKRRKENEAWFLEDLENEENIKPRETN